MDTTRFEKLRLCPALVLAPSDENASGRTWRISCAREQAERLALYLYQMRTEHWSDHAVPAARIFPIFFL